MSDALTRQQPPVDPSKTVAQPIEEIVAAGQVRQPDAESNWLTFVGGTALVRDAVRNEFEGSEVGSVESVARATNASLLVVFCDRDVDLSTLGELASQPGQHAIAIAPNHDAALFSQLLRSGVSGVTTEHASVHQLVDVARAALSDDVLLPAEMVRSMLSERSGQPASSDLGSVDDAILNELANGKSIKDIAAALHYGERTVQRRIKVLCETLGAVTATQAIHLAHQHGML